MLTHIYRRSTAGEAMLYAWFAAMHTRVDIVIRANRDKQSLLHVVEAMQQRIFDIEKIANCFDQSSELAHLNASPVGEAVPISNELKQILQLGQRYNAMTDGLFDIMAESECHDHDVVSDLAFDENGMAVLKKEGLKINLSGMIKGYAAEQLRPILQSNDIENAMINMGNSSVMTIGCQTESTGWKVGISREGIVKEAVLQDLCLTTSGNDAPQRQHIIDPRDGQYRKGQGFVSVITRNAADGEALSTSLFIDHKKSFPAFGEYQRMTYNR